MVYSIEHAFDIPTGHHSPRRPGFVLRVGGATRRSRTTRATGCRRGRHRVGSELRGQGVWGLDPDGRVEGTATLPRPGGGAAAIRRVRRREQGGIRGLPEHDASRRAHVDRRGLSRRWRPEPGEWKSVPYRRAVAGHGARRGGAAHFCRSGHHEVLGQGGFSGIEARRVAGGCSRGGDGLSFTRFR